MMAQPLLHDPSYLTERRASNRGKKLHIDYVGLALLSVGLASVEILLDKGQQEDWFSSRLIVGLAIVGGLSLLAAIVWEFDHPHPILNLRLLAERNFMICCLIAVVLYACVYTCNVLLPQLIQTQMGYSPTMAGMVLSPAGLFTMAIVPLVGVMLTRGVDPRLLIGVGLFGAGAATVWMSHMNLLVSPSHILWPRVLQSCGAGLMFVPLSTIAFRFLPREESGNASALYALVRNEGSSIGVALVTTLLARSTQTHQAMLVEHVSQYNPIAVDTLSHMTKTFGDPISAMHVVYSMVGQQAAILAYFDQFRRFGWMVLLIVLLVFLLRKPGVTPAGASAEVAH